jgi:hypothetical protein
MIPMKAKNVITRENKQKYLNFTFLLQIQKMIILYILEILKMQILTNI